MANSVTISWTKGELVSYISNLSAYVAQTLSLSGEVAFNINTLTEDNEQTFLNDKLAEGVNALVPYFSRIIADDVDVQSGAEVQSEVYFGITFTPRIEGGSYSKAELSHIKTLCRKIVASYVLADWYSVKGVAAMNTYFATQVAQSATELNVVLDRFVRPVRKVSVNIGRVTYANKNAANYKHINNRSDFVLEWGTTNGEPLPDGEYDIDFYTDGEVVRSVNSLDTNVVKPIEGANDKVRIIFDFADGEYFGYGVLKYMMRGDILDADFPDGLRHFELSGDTSIEIWDGASDGEDVYSASYIPSYMKLTFDDLTQEEIEQLQRPALEAAEVANEAARRANEAAENAFNNEGTYPKMSVGFAENIVGDGSATSEVFSFRPTAGENRNTLNDGAARIQVLKGSSVVVNNRLTTIWGVNGGSLTNSGFKYTFTASTAGWLSIYQNIGFVAGHKYLFSVKITLPHADTVVLGTPNNGNAQYRQALAANSPTQVEGVVNCTESYGEFYIYPNWNTVSKVGEVYTIEKPIVVDLTQMFGVGNEPTTVAEFYQRKPIGVDLLEYNVGEIVDGNYKAIKTTGFNQWDEEWENGYYDKTTGVFKSNANYLCSKNPIKVIGGSTYNLLSTFPNQIEFCYYDASGNFVGSQIAYNGLKYTIPNGVCSLNFATYATNYNDQQFCINLSWDEYASMNGTYKPYKSFVRDLSWVAKYFPNGMRSAGNVADEIRFNSSTQKWEAVQRVGVLDLGTQGWNRQTDTGIFFTDPIANMQTTQGYTQRVDGCCSIYPASGVTSINATMWDLSFLREGNRIYIKDSAYTDTNTFRKAMAGVLFNHPLAEPIVTEIAENVNLDYDCSDYGTEELLSDGASAPLCADIVYEPNVLATIKNLPNLFARLAQMEAMVSAMAVSTINMNE